MTILKYFDVGFGPGCRDEVQVTKYISPSESSYSFSVAMLRPELRQMSLVCRVVALFVYVYTISQKYKKVFTSHHANVTLMHKFVG